MKQLLRKIPFLFKCLKIIKINVSIVVNQLRIKLYVLRCDKLKIVIGASNVFQKNWCPTDQENLNLLSIESFNKLFKSRKIDTILAEHVWEHLTIDEALIAANNCYSYILKDGYIRVAVPDGFHPDDKYIEAVDVGGTGLGSDDHKVLYNYKTLSSVFEEAGFRVNLLEYFDESGNFQQVDWNRDKGMIHRSAKFDERNHLQPLAYTSIIIDAFKI